ncbi:MAG: hypothetical protein ABI166_09670, partial [Mucilaginibacter sp.]
VELRKSLPDGWQMFPEKKLPGDEICISHAIVEMKEGKERKVNIFVWPLSLELNASLKEKLLLLRDEIVATKGLLIVINEEIAEMSLGDAGVFISETLLIHCPNFLWISCCLDRKYQMTFDGIRFKSLHSGLSNIWNAKVTYKGPEIGSQQVNLEIMSDTCWKCQRKIRTVTGIVFPDQQMKNWENPNWRYYLSLVSINQIKGDTADVIAAFVVTLRQDNAGITPVGYKRSNAVKRSYFAASCPYCGALRGNFYVMDDRMGYLHSLQSRIDGTLTYHTISLDIDQYLIQSLFDSSEACDHTTNAGWLE